ncbi:MAG: hypothetical protein EAZ89_06285 [Bacteroidetes bacterium]|nr:MAG: hypothetical protein EAZ89_06285 [Bacteroidota bacterium]
MKAAHIWIGLLLLLAIAMRVEHRYFYRNFFPDTQAQLAAADSWLKGGDFAICEADTSAPEGIGSHSMRTFPPGYSLLVYLVYLLLHDWISAAFWIDALAVAALLCGMLVWLRRLGTPPVGQIVWLIFAACAPAPFHFMAASDLISAALFVWSLAFLTRERWEKLSSWLPAIVCLAAALWIRPAYLPALGIVPLYLFFRKNEDGKRHIGVAAVALLVCGLAVVLFWVLNWRSDTLLGQTKPGFYPQNLLHADVFLLKSFFYYGIPHEQQISERMPALYPVFKAVSFLLNGLLMAALVWAVLGSRRARASGFSLLLVLSAGWTLGMLALLSLVWPADTWNWISYWTFLMETRYYAPLQLLALALLWSAAFSGSGQRVAKMIRIWILCATALNMLWPVYMHVNLLRQGRLNASFPEQHWPETLEAIRTWKADHPGRTLLFQEPNGGQVAAIAGACILPQSIPARCNESFDSQEITLMYKGLKSDDPPPGEVYAAWGDVVLYLIECE